MQITKGRIAAAVITAAALVVGAAAAASAAETPVTTGRDTMAPANSVNSTAIINGSVGFSDMYAGAHKAYITTYNATVGWPALRPEIREEITKGNVSGVESDAPYPSATQLGDFPGNGSNSTELVPGDEGAASHTVWVKCADGKVATGGGFILGADQALSVKKAMQVISSEATGEAIEGDAAGSILPTGWKVEVVNNGTVDAMVRPLVNCVAVSAAR